MAGMSPVPAESKIPAGPNGYVQDMAGVLNGMEISVLEEPLADYKKKTQQRIDILLVGSTGGEPIGSYSEKVISNPSSFSFSFFTGKIYILSFSVNVYMCDSKSYYIYVIKTK